MPSYSTLATPIGERARKFHFTESFKKSGTKSSEKSGCTISKGKVHCWLEKVFIYLLNISRKAV